MFTATACRGRMDESRSTAKHFGCRNARRWPLSRAPGDSSNRSVSVSRRSNGFVKLPRHPQRVMDRLRREAIVRGHVPLQVCVNHHRAGVDEYAAPRQQSVVFAAAAVAVAARHGFLAGSFLVEPWEPLAVRHLDTEVDLRLRVVDGTAILREATIHGLRTHTHTTPGHTVGVAHAHSQTSRA